MLHEIEEADLRDRIEQVVEEYPRYGYRRVTHHLRREGFKVNHKRVSRIMREESLQCQVKRHWVKTTDSDHPYRVYPNLLKGLRATRPNQAWVADITYIRILTGFLYLAGRCPEFSWKWLVATDIKHHYFSLVNQFFRLCGRFCSSVFAL